MANMATQDITNRMSILGCMAYEWGVADSLSTALDAWVVQFTERYAAVGDARVDAVMGGIAAQMATRQAQSTGGVKADIVNAAKALVRSPWFYGAFSVQPATFDENTVLTRFAAELAAIKANKSIDTSGALRAFLNLVAGTTNPTWLTAAAPADYSDAAYVVI